MAHSLCSPSSAHRWTHCNGAPVFESFYPDESSSFAQEGTDAHALAAHLLDPEHNEAPAPGVVPEENVEYVQEYVDFVRENTEGAAVLRIEHPLRIAQVTHEPNAKGTADCLAIVGTQLKIIDLKFGRGVKVDAEDNDQLAIYALAALDEFSLVEDIKTVEVTIFQPRLSHVSSMGYKVEALEALRTKYTDNAERVITLKKSVDAGAPIPFAILTPTISGCKFCKAKADCPALARCTTEATGIDVGAAPVDVFPQVVMGDGVAMAKKLAVLDRIEAWVTAVRARAYEMLDHGLPVPGFKLVQGRKGARKWTDEKAVEAMLKDAGDEIYTKKLVTPTQAERLVKKAVLDKDTWKKVQEHITQPEGAPTIAPESDNRPAVMTSADAFESLVS